MNRAPLRLTSKETSCHAYCVAEASSTLYASVMLCIASKHINPNALASTFVNIAECNQTSTHVPEAHADMMQQQYTVAEKLIKS